MEVCRCDLSVRLSCSAGVGRVKEYFAGPSGNGHFQEPCAPDSPFQPAPPTPAPHLIRRPPGKAGAFSIPRDVVLNIAGFEEAWEVAAARCCLEACDEGAE
jgi:hypothetical protein